jgi:hypothetical protein
LNTTIKQNKKTEKKMSYQTRDGSTRITGGGTRQLYSAPSTTTWRDGFRELVQTREYVKAKRSIMSELERQQYDEKLERLMEANLGRASSGMEAEILEAASKVKSRERVLKSYRMAEAENWDAAKQQVAYQGISNRLAEAAADNITGGAQFKAVYEDARNSKYALLAFSELMPKYARAKSDMQLNALARQASEQVREMRNTPDILDKQSALNEAVIELGGRLKEANHVHQALYGADINQPLYSDSLSRTAKRITWSENGELEILAPDDGRVTGVYFSGIPEEVQGG